jgi:hypothetical protein
MSEKRKPELVLFAEIPGKHGKKLKRIKVECFHVSQWANPKSGKSWRPVSITMFRADVYRVRVNGTWYRTSDRRFETLTLSQIFTVLRRTVAAVRARRRSEPKSRIKDLSDQS